MIKEAFNVKQETGFTPRQLKNKADNFESVAKLIKTLNIQLESENKELKEQREGLERSLKYAQERSIQLEMNIFSIAEQRDELLKIIETMPGISDHPNAWAEWWIKRDKLITKIGYDIRVATNTYLLMEKFKKEVLECYHGHDNAKMLHSVELLVHLSGKEVFTCRDKIQEWLDETEES